MEYNRKHIILCTNWFRIYPVIFWVQIFVDTNLRMWKTFFVKCLAVTKNIRTFVYEFMAFGKNADIY